MKSNLAQRCGALVAAVGLSSCGGGGSDGGDDANKQLSGTVVIRASAEVLQQSSIGATLPAGASGQPVCSFDAGVLPPGMGLNATGCTLFGIPEAVGSYSVQLTLTIPGYAGSTRIDATITIAGLERGPPSAPTGTPLINTPVSGLALVGLTFTPPFTLKPADLVDYRITSGRLPAGLTLDPVTGTVSGTPTESGGFPLTIGARLSRGGLSYQIPPFSTAISILAPG
jgi:hypothetical protein